MFSTLRVNCPNCDTPFSSATIPYSGTCGHSYCRDCIVKQTCPQCQCKYFKKSVVNTSLLELIKLLEERERENAYQVVAQNFEIDQIEEIGRPIPIPNELAEQVIGHIQNLQNLVNSAQMADGGRYDQEEAETTV